MRGTFLRNTFGASRTSSPALGHKSYVVAALIAVCACRVQVTVVGP